MLFSGGLVLAHDGLDEDDGQILEEYKARREARKRKKDILANDLRFAEKEVEECVLDEAELAEQFPDGYRELPYETGYRIEYTRAKLVVIEEHIHAYKGKKDGRIIRAGRPEHLMPHSVLTPSLGAAVVSDKFVNAVPVNRLSEEFRRMDVTLRPQTMDRWVMALAECYVKPLVCRMKALMLEKAKLVHADETPFVVEQDRKLEGHSKSSKSYMWVYHTGRRYGSPDIYIYEYQPDRKGCHPAQFLKGYNGIIMTDGYEPYHTIGKEREGEIKVAGCWAHLKRKFAEVIKPAPDKGKGTVAYEGNLRIAAIYHVDNMAKDAPACERLAHRKSTVAPLVDAFFEWVKERDGKVATKATQAALSYAINQEEYLRAFLDDGIIPLDNNDAERSIRKFCIGRNNWVLAATSRGADAAAMMYSMAETLKANRIKPYEYFEYIFKEMRHNENSITAGFLDSLLPWSDTLPQELHMKGI